MIKIRDVIMADNNENPSFFNRLFKKITPIFYSQELESLKKDPGERFRFAIEQFYFNTFPPDGVDPINNTYDGKPLTIGSLTEDTRRLSLARSSRLAITSFFGITNRIFNAFENPIKPANPEQGVRSRSPMSPRKIESPRSKSPYITKQAVNINTKLGLQEIIKNFFGWHKESDPLVSNQEKYILDVPSWRKAFSYSLIFPVLMGIFNTGRIVLKTVWNIVRFFTEFLPGVLEISSLFAFAKIKDIYDSTKADSLLNGGLIFGLGFLLFLVGLFHLSCKIWRVAGRMITSPTDSMRAGWELGQELLPGTKGKVLGGVLAFLSFAGTVAIYTFVFPLGIKAIAAHAPAAISNAYAWVTNPATISKAISFVSQASTLVRTACVVAFFTLNAAVDRLSAKITNWWHNIGVPPQIKAEPSRSGSSRPPSRVAKPPSRSSSRAGYSNSPAPEISAQDRLSASPSPAFSLSVDVPPSVDVRHLEDEAVEDFRIVQNSAQHADFARQQASASDLPPLYPSKQAASTVSPATSPEAADPTTAQPKI